MIDEYAGCYVVFGNMTPINRNGNSLEIELWGNKLDLIPISNDTFVSEATAFGFVSVPLLKFSLQFKTVKGTQVALLHGLPAPFAFQKVPEYTISEAWKNRLGLYQTNTLDELFEIGKVQLDIDDGILLFNVNLQGKSADSDTEIKIALNPISDTEAVVIGLADGEGGTVRVIKTGESEDIYYSGFMFSPVVKNKSISMH